MNDSPYKVAIRLGLPTYFTGKPCKNGHTAERRADDSYMLLEQWQGN
jgi:hypothetical protein